MTQKNFSFWFCTLLSGIVIGIASQRIPQAHANPDTLHAHPYASYCHHAAQPQKQGIPKIGHSLAYEGYNNSTWVYEHFKKDSTQTKKAY